MYMLESVCKAAVTLCRLGDLLRISEGVAL